MGKHSSLLGTFVSYVCNGFVTLDLDVSVENNVLYLMLTQISVFTQSVYVPISKNQLPVSVTRWQHESKTYFVNL